MNPISVPLAFVLATSSASTLIHAQAGAPLFPEQATEVADRPNGFALGDLDGDGKPDVVTANSNIFGDGSKSVSVLLGDGLGGFSRRTDVSMAHAPNSAALGDMNGDGRLDLVTTDFHRWPVVAKRVSVLLGDGLGGFGPSTDLAVAYSPYSVVLG